MRVGKEKVISIFFKHSFKHYPFFPSDLFSTIRIWSSLRVMLQLCLTIVVFPQRARLVKGQLHQSRKVCHSRGSDFSLSITIKVRKSMRMGKTNELWAAFLIRSISLRAKGFTDWQRSFVLFEIKDQTKPKYHYTAKMTHDTDWLHCAVLAVI